MRMSAIPTMFHHEELREYRFAFVYVPTDQLILTSEKFTLNGPDAFKLHERIIRKVQTNGDITMTTKLGNATYIGKEILPKCVIRFGTDLT